MIYLDNNATTVCDPEIVREMADIWGRGAANPASQHSIGRTASSLLDDAIIRIGKCLGSDLETPGAARLIVTSGGTESNNLALSGLGRPEDPLVVSSIEHASVLAFARHAEEQGRTVRYIPVGPSGLVDRESLAATLADLSPSTAVVSVMSANNETGVIQPILDVAEISRAAGALLHVDATQSFGKLSATVTDIPADAITITPHKFHGPTGIGALWIAEGIKLRAQLFGGEQQLLTRPGTVPLPLVCGMASALETAVEKLSSTGQLLVSLRDRMESGLREAVPDLLIHGANENRLPGTTCVSFPGTDRQSMLMALDMAGVAASSGSACSSGSSPPSHVLTAMGCPDWAIQSAIRFGVCRFSTVSEIDDSLTRICRVYNRLRS